MEMHPPLLRERHGGKEQVHQHGLAAPDLAMEIEPARAMGRLFKKAEDPFGLAGDQIVKDPIKLPGRFHLCRVGRQGAAGDEVVISGQDGTVSCGGT
ncbi:hypothetical protein D3C87_2023710 [compost metagenome]